MNERPTPTAGLRGAYWDPARLPEGVRLTVHPLSTEDGQTVSGFLLATGRETCVAVIAHPREHLVPHYLAAELVAGGVAVFLQAPRLTGNDIRLEHEFALYDLAAALSFLRGAAFDKSVAVGNSGGGPLWAFYNQQALLDGNRRIAKTPGGRPTKLETATLPALDGLIFVSAHLGQGKLLMNGIDPSVREETDPFSTDKELDPFDAANGYAEGGQARYSSEFTRRYRAAQRARVERIELIRAPACSSTGRSPPAPQGGEKLERRSRPGSSHSYLSSMAHRRGSPLLGPEHRPLRSPRRFALGCEPVRFELWQHRIRARVYAGELAIHVVRS